jgi:hypothetical protein
VLRNLIVATGCVAALVVAGGVAAARSVPHLSASGPTSVSGTDGTGVFAVGDRTVRQVRYVDGGTLGYSFRLTNEGRLPVTVMGLSASQAEPRLFALVGLTGRPGEKTIQIGPGATRTVTLALGMSGCETLSARSGSFVTEVLVRTEHAGVFDDEVLVTLPEELHTGSAREAFCPRSTATSRPSG